MGTTSTSMDMPFIFWIPTTSQHSFWSQAALVITSPTTMGQMKILKYLYNNFKASWILKYRSTKFTAPHINVVLVEAWYTFWMSSRNIIRDRFGKNKCNSPQTSRIHCQYPVVCCLRPSPFHRKGWRHQYNIMAHLQNTQSTGKYYQQSDGYLLINEYSIILQ